MVQDDQIRKLIFKDYRAAQIDRIEIERTQSTIVVFIYCGQTGIILGKEGAELKVLTLKINKIVGRKIKVHINVLQYENVA